MSKFEDFNEGDTVQHETNGMGTVEAIVDGCVRVRFDRADKDGKHWFGMFDDDWFRIHPELLSRI